MRNWLGKQLDSAKREVQSWGEWKRDTMRREATSIASERITVAPNPDLAPETHVAELRVLRALAYAELAAAELRQWFSQLQSGDRPFPHHAAKVALRKALESLGT